jgi:hypothetical protein
MGRAVRQGFRLSPILSKLYSEHITDKCLVMFGDFKTAGQVILTVKYTDDLVPLAKGKNDAIGHD